MTREELIEKAAKKYCQDNIPSLPQMHPTISTAFEAGVIWAAKHQSFDLVIKAWNSAVKTTISQINKEMSEFSSEKEILDYIQESLQFDLLD